MNYKIKGIKKIKSEKFESKFSKKDIKDGLLIALEGIYEPGVKMKIRVSYKYDNEFVTFKEYNLMSANIPEPTVKLDLNFNKNPKKEDKETGFGEYMVSIEDENGKIANFVTFSIVKKNIIPFLFIPLVLFIVVGGAFVFMNQDTPTKPNNNRPGLLESTGNKNIGTLSENLEERQKQLNEAVNMIRIKCTSAVIFENAKSLGKWNIQNTMKDVLLQVAVYPYDKTNGFIDESTPLYISPVLNPGDELIEEGTVTPYWNGDFVGEDYLYKQDLEAGIYDCVAVFSTYDLDQNYLGHANYNLVIQILN